MVLRYHAVPFAHTKATSLTSIGETAIEIRDMASIFSSLSPGIRCSLIGRLFQHHYTPFITSATSIDWMVGYITWRLAQTSGLKKKYHAMAFSSMFTFTTRVTPTTSDSTRHTKGPISQTPFSVLAVSISSQHHLCFTILTITGMNILFPAS